MTEERWRDTKVSSNREMFVPTILGKRPICVGLIMIVRLGRCCDREASSIDFSHAEINRFARAEPFFRIGYSGMRLDCNHARQSPNEFALQ